MKTYHAGIDIGSTTVKLVLLDENDNIVFGEYQRHHANTQRTLAQLLRRAHEQLGHLLLKVKITGSGSINLGKAMEIGFVQEVVAVATALQHQAPQTDVAIELGGEDAKIIYFKGGLEERMNGVWLSAVTSCTISAVFTVMLFLTMKRQNDIHVS